MVLLRVLRATLILSVLAIGMAMHTAHHRARANEANVASMCRTYLERRAASTRSLDHPLVRSFDEVCAVRREG